MKISSFCLSLSLEISGSTFLFGPTEVLSCAVDLGICFVISSFLSPKAFDVAVVGPDADGSAVGLTVSEDCGNFGEIDF